MADLSAIGALSSLSEKDLYYQYLINNNSASTMFNALAGNSTQDSGGLGLSGLMGMVNQVLYQGFHHFLVHPLGFLAVTDLALLAWYQAFLLF